MMSYRDRTWCTFSGCVYFSDCDRALTLDVEKRARDWWGPYGDPPFSIFAEKPKCFEEDSGEEK